MHRLSGLVVALLVLAGGCGGTASGAQAGDDPVTAAAAVYPLAWIASSVAPDAQVEYLGGTGADPHDLELSPDQRVAVEQADVVLYLGDIGFMPQVEEATASVNGEIVRAAEVIGEDNLLVVGGQAHDHGHQDARAALDPHLWFDPELMAQVALRTGEAFAAADPANAQAYTTNAEAVAEELTAVDAEIAALLGGTCEFDEVIVSHEAYGYLLAPYGKQQHGVAGVAPKGGASGGELAELVAEIDDEGFRHVLAEPVEGRSDAEALATEVGIEVLEINPLERSLSQEQMARGYPALLREQAETFATALGCS